MPLDAVLVAGVPLILVIPACVEVLKRAGLPEHLAGLAAITVGCVLVALADLATGSTSWNWANWMLGGIVYGLAAAGFYSQTRKMLT